MGLLNRFSGREGGQKFTSIEADADLFESVEAELPEEPMVRLRPRKDSQGLEHAAPLVRNLYHYREDALGRNISPVNSFEIWFNDGEIRFYFHPDTHEQKNSAVKQIEDKYPGTKMVEEQSPIPEINEGDYIAGGRMTLSNHYARPLKMPGGPSAFSRDPYGPLTSEMVVEDERLPSGQRVRSDEVRMVIQTLFQPISRDWTKGGLLSQDLNDYADDLKQPKIKGSSSQQIIREFLGGGTEMRKPTKKAKRTASLISELRGEPGFLCRVRVICISPYEEVARQHVSGVCEVFETYYSPITEQGFNTLPRSGDSLREMLAEVAGREMSTSWRDKFSSQRDILSVPELAGVVHLPNDEIETPTVDWTKMEKGAGVPTSSPDLEDVNEQIEAADQGQADTEDTDQERMRTFSPDDLTADEADFNLEIEADGFERPDQTQQPPADGRGLATDVEFGDILDGEDSRSEEPEDGDNTEDRSEDEESWSELPVPEQAPEQADASTSTDSEEEPGQEQNAAAEPAIASQEDLPEGVLDDLEEAEDAGE